MEVVMPFVSGFLRARRRGHPDIGLPDPEHPVDPDYGIEGPSGPPDWGIDEGAGIGGGPVLPPPIMWPKPPPGLWPPPEKPITPLPPNFPMPPGSIWPPIHPPVDPGYGRPESPPHVGGGPAPEPPTVGGGPAPQPPRPGLPPVVGGGPVVPGEKFLAALVTVGRGRTQVIGYTVVDTSLSPGLPLPPYPQPK